MSEIHEVSMSRAGREAHHGAHAFDVVVVGGGVSGCACAAAVSAAGLSVLVVSSALDVIGLPGYGPALDLSGGADESARQVLERLPEGLRRAWLESALVDAGDQATMVVDRRVVSIETKRALEAMPGLRFRQALITDLRPSRGGTAGESTVEVESAFGEVFEGRAVVLAPGLSLGGEVVVGDETLPGGRYGEVAATDLRATLVRLGATFKDVTIVVGARFGGDDIAVSTEDRLNPVAWGGDAAGTGPTGSWPADFPPAPHLLDARQPGTLGGERVAGGLAGRANGEAADAEVAAGRANREVADVEAAAGRAAADGGDVAGDLAGNATGHVAGHAAQPRGGPAVLWPDGVATAEYYLHPGDPAPACLDEPGPLPTRLEHIVRASVLMCAGCESGTPGGIVWGLEPHVWVAGQAAGAVGYCETLRSGLDVAELVVAHLRPDRVGA